VVVAHLGRHTEDRIAMLRSAVPLTLMAACLATAAQPARAIVPVPPAVTLTVTGNDGAGHVRVARLSCRNLVATATGFLHYRAARACFAARTHRAFLGVPPPIRRICTQIYGGPQTARVRGVVGDTRIDRRFSRRNGCEISDWTRVEPLLPRFAGLLAP
jgi:hypothetical protein